MDINEIKEWLRENLEIVVGSAQKYSPGNNQTVGLRFKDEEKCFVEETIYIPDD